MCKKLLLVLALGLMLTSAANAELVGWWKFDEASGDTAQDSSGNGNDGTLNGSATFAPTEGQVGGALSMDGSAGGYVLIPNAGELTLINQGDFTITMWFRQDVVTGIANLLQQTDLNGTGRTLLLADAATGIRTYLGGTSTVSGIIEEAGVWYHVAMIVTEEGATDTINFYINGEPEGTPAQVGSEDSEGDYLIGTDKGLAGRWMDGLVDDFRLYNHALSDLEVLAAMEGSAGGYPLASAPNPADGVLLEATWANISWRAGDSAVTHDVYLGDNFDDVNDGVGDSFQGNQAGTTLIVGFPGFPLPGGLVPGTSYFWRIDEVNDADPNSPWKGDVWSFTVPPKKAYNPIPADGVKFVDTAATLSWTAGFSMKLSHVYFGNDFDAVSSAEGAPAQTDTTYTPGALEMETTYYWRVDEFDGATTNRGDVWSFATIPDVAVTDPDLALWWTLDEGEGATAVDWSGHGNHGAIVGDAQWAEGYHGPALTFASGVYIEASEYQGVTGTAPRTCCAWIRTTTAGNRNIMSWGQNVAGQKWRMRVNDTSALRIEVSGGYHIGVTNVADGRWHHVAVTFEDDGSPDVLDTLLYVDGQLDATDSSLDEPVDTTDGPVRLGASSWNEEPIVGQIDDARVYTRVLTQEEIMLVMRGDPLLAWSPSPATGSTPDIDSATPLTWSPGDTVSQHDVYFGLDKDAVANADTSDTAGLYRGGQTGTSFTPAEGVQWGGGPYYWRIDENNTDGTVTKGRVWTFTVADFILVEDFESYTDNDADNEAIWQSWIDGFGVPTNGSQVGYLLPPYAEQTIVNGGFQSMPLGYDNTSGVRNSEAALALTAPRDWTRNGVGALSLWFRGYPPSVGSFAEGPVGTFTMTAAGADIWGSSDEFHFAYRTLSGPGSIVARVDSVQNTHNWAKAGVMIRETLDADSRHAIAVVSAASGIASQGRTDTGTTSFGTTEAGITAPHWVRLERDVTGNFTVSHSTNGSTWVAVVNSVPTNVPMAADVYVGLALTSHNAAETCEARFSNVTVTGTVGSQWMSRDIGVLGNNAEPLYVSLSNNTGAPAVVTHDDPVAATIDEWTEWVIDLTGFADQGVNLANVDKIAIGLGATGDPAASGGSGTVFIDDIRLLRPAGE